MKKNSVKKWTGMILAVALLAAMPLTAQAQQPGLGETVGTGILEETEISELDVQDSFSEVQQRAEGGTEYLTKYGITRDGVVRELEAHQSDNFYLGTPYKPGDWQSPRGDTRYNGSAGMDCAGFVSYVLRKVGLDASTVMRVIQKVPGQTNWNGSGKPYDILSGANNYLNLVTNGNLTAYAFRTKEELLSSGLAEKGDILLMWWNQQPGYDGEDNHIGFFWGDSPSEDKMWHSGLKPKEENQISAIIPQSAGSYYILIKLEKQKVVEERPHHPVFEDVPLDAWYYDAVDYVYQAGLFSGVTADTFVPANAMTRGMFVTVLGKFAHADPSDYSAGSFRDVSEKDYYAPYVEWAVEKGLVTGIGGECFAPNQWITREQMATVFYKYAQMVGADTTLTPDELLAFPDGLETSEYARDAMAWAVTHGVLSGSGGDLLPQGTATRAQTAQILYNAKKLLTTPVETPETGEESALESTAENSL